MKYLETVKENLEKIKPELIEKFDVSSIGLFGSIVRDDFTSDSDIDIIVEFSHPVGIEFIDLAEFLENKFNRKIDLVSKNGIKKNYFSEIENEIIYV
ncbi:MAG: nucleotidyltransferase family protein [Firmicutes bacterium]|nr:nucleotidyltransferase family protein [Bacillota bacterium]